MVFIITITVIVIGFAHTKQLRQEYLKCDFYYPFKFIMLSCLLQILCLLKPDCDVHPNSCVLVAFKSKCVGLRSWVDQPARAIPFRPASA